MAHFTAIQRTPFYKAYKSPHWVVNIGHPMPPSLDVIYSTGQKWVQGHPGWLNLYTYYPGYPFTPQSALSSFYGMSSDSATYYENYQRAWTIYNLRTDTVIMGDRGYNGTRDLQGSGNAPQVSGYPSPAELSGSMGLPWPDPFVDDWWDYDALGAPIFYSTGGFVYPDILDVSSFPFLPPTDIAFDYGPDEISGYTDYARMSGPQVNATIANAAISEFGGHTWSTSWATPGFDLQWSEWQALGGTTDTRSINPASYTGSPVYSTYATDYVPGNTIATGYLWNFTRAVSGWTIYAPGRIGMVRAKLRWTGSEDTPYYIGKYKSFEINVPLAAPRAIGDGDWRINLELIESGTFSAGSSPIIREVPFPGSSNDDRALDAPFPFQYDPTNFTYPITSSGYFYVLGSLPGDFWGDHYGFTL